MIIQLEFGKSSFVLEIKRKLAIMPNYTLVSSALRFMVNRLRFLIKKRRKKHES